MRSSGSTSSLLESSLSSRSKRRRIPRSASTPHRYDVVVSPNGTRRMFNGRDWRRLCSADGCSKLGPRRGLCIRHYQSWLGTILQSPDTPLAQRSKQTPQQRSQVATPHRNDVVVRPNGTRMMFDGHQWRRLCSTDGCTKLSRRGGLCLQHYQSWLGAISLSPDTPLAQGSKQTPQQRSSSTSPSHGTGVKSGESSRESDTLPPHYRVTGRVDPDGVANMLSLIMQEYNLTEDEDVAQCPNDCDDSSLSNSPTENYVGDADLSENTGTELINEIIVKEEIDIEEECFIAPIDSICNAQRVPVVYTTKLDDMLIFKKNFSSLSFLDIESNILLESKPKLIKLSKHKTQVNLDNEKHIFLNLVKIIRRFNALCTEQDFENEGEDKENKKKESDNNIEEVENKEIKEEYDKRSEAEEDKENVEEDIPLSMLSSKRFDLNIDCQETAAKLPTRKGKLKQLLKLCKPCFVHLVPSCKVASIAASSFVMYDQNEKNKHLQFLKGVRYKINIGSCLIFKQIKTNTMDIYMLSKNGLCYKTINISGYSSYNAFLEPSDFILTINDCCWYKREYVLKNLIWSKRLNPVRVMRKTHSCPSGQCSCCCKENFIDDDDIIEVPVSALPKNDIDDPSSIYRNTPKISVITDSPKNKKKQGKTSAKSLACQLVSSFTKNLKTMKNKKIRRKKTRQPTNENITTENFPALMIPPILGVQILSNSSDMAEYYECGSNENIFKYIEVKSKNLEIINQFRKAKMFNVDCNKSFCCWHSRDIKLRTFELRHSKIPQFARTPHPCNPDHCICCCKPNLPKLLLQDKDLTSFDPKSKHTYNYTSIIQQRRKFHVKPNNTPKNNYVSSDIPCETRDYKTAENNVLLKKHVESNVSSPKTYSWNSIMNDNIVQNSISKEPFLEKSVHKYEPLNKLTKKQFENNIKMSVVPSTSTIFQPSPQSQPVSSVQSIQKSMSPLAAQQAELSQFIQNTVASDQSNVAIPVYHSLSVVNHLKNIPLQNNAQEPIVDSLVKSILQRFKDVRLVITTEGDVTAELGTPVKVFSTLELKLLSQILIHAKTVVKQLKEAGHFNTNKKIILNSWLKNVDNDENVTEPTDTTPEVIPSSPTTPAINVNHNEFRIPVRNDALERYTSLSALKTKEYLTSCTSYLKGFNFAPKIQDVYSLNENVINSNLKVNSTYLAQSQGKSETFNESETIMDPSTSCAKRKREENPIKDTKKLKMHMIEPTELDDSDTDSVRTKLLQHNESPINNTISDDNTIFNRTIVPKIDLMEIDEEEPVALPKSVPLIGEPTLLPHQQSDNDLIRDTPTTDNSFIVDFQVIDS